MENIELVSFIAKCCHLLPFMSLLYQKCWNQLAQNVQFLQKRTKLATFLFTSVTYQCQRLPGINCSSYLLISLFHYINHYIGFSAYLWHPKSNCAIALTQQTSPISHIFWADFLPFDPNLQLAAVNRVRSLEKQREGEAYSQQPPHI